MVSLTATFGVVEDAALVELEGRLVGLDVDGNRLLVDSSEQAALTRDVSMAGEGHERTASLFATAGLVGGAGVVRVICLGAEPILGDEDVSVQLEPALAALVAAAVVCLIVALY
jgi:hypothetical protein